MSGRRRDGVLQQCSQPDRVGRTDRTELPAIYRQPVPAACHSLGRPVHPTYLAGWSDHEDRPSRAVEYAGHRVAHAVGDGDSPVQFEGTPEVWHQGAHQRTLGDRERALPFGASDRYDRQRPRCSLDHADDVSHKVVRSGELCVERGPLQFRMRHQLLTEHHRAGWDTSKLDTVSPGIERTPMLLVEGARRRIHPYRQRHASMSFGVD